MEFKDDFQFEFDQPQPEQQPADREGLIELAEPMHRLTCSCPHCAADIELELPEPGQQVVETSCAACNAAVALVRESSATRARQHSRDISCALCGSRLSHHPHCTSCGALFPDYFVALKPEEVRRRASSKRRSDLRQALARLNPSLRFDFSRSHAERHLGTSDTAPTRQTSRQALVTPRTVRLLVALLVITALAAGGGYFFRLRQQQQQFAENYFRALFVIKSGNEFALKACSRMTTDWKAAAAAGAAYTPRLNDREDARLKTTQQNLDTFLQRLNPPPSKFSASHQKLVELQNAYRTSRTVATTPPGTLQALTAAADQAGAGFTTTARDLKSTLPPLLKEEFEKAKKKYRGLEEL